MIKLLYILLLGFLLCGVGNKALGQEQPPRPLSVYINPLQGLSFGAFFQGNTGGTIVVFHDGTRSATGDLILANFGFPVSPAIFEIDAEPGTRVALLNGSDVTLTGSNGGTINLHIGTSNKGSSFVTTAIPPSRTELRIGGTLTVGSALANPSGAYSGSFQITFMQE